VLTTACASPAFAQDKSVYHLFNPMPPALMREMSTDRPDKTESPYTVDAGHFQVEMSALDYTYDHEDPGAPLARRDAYSIAPINLKAGLLNNVDLQVVLEPYINETVRDDGETTRQRGFGDVQVRTKVNFWGNDGGETAFALMPFVKFPTASKGLGNGALEGGLIVPFAVGLPHDWSMGIMAEIDVNKNASNKDYHPELIQSITFSHAIAGALGGYIEFFNNTSLEDKAEWVASVDVGLTYKLNKNVQADIGVNIGLNAPADDLNPFCGLSWRY